MSAFFAWVNRPDQVARWCTLLGSAEAPRAAPGLRRAEGRGCVHPPSWSPRQSAAYATTGPSQQSPGTSTEPSPSRRFGRKRDSNHREVECVPLERIEDSDRGVDPGCCRQFNSALAHKPFSHRVVKVNVHPPLSVGVPHFRLEIFVLWIVRHTATLIAGGGFVGLPASKVANVQLPYATAKGCVFPPRSAKVLT